MQNSQIKSPEALIYDFLSNSGIFEKTLRITRKDIFSVLSPEIFRNILDRNEISNDFKMYS